MKRNILVLIAISLIAVVLGISFAVNSVFFSKTSSSQGTACTECHFVGQPVGDLIIPLLAPNAASGAVNNPLNLTIGQSVSLEVDLYLTVRANVSMKFEVFPPIGSTSNNFGNSSFDAKFSPSNLSAVPNKKASTILSLSVLSSATIGRYSAVVVAVDSSNTSITWGDYFQINVRG